MRTKLIVSVALFLALGVLAAIGHPPSADATDAQPNVFEMILAPGDGTVVYMAPDYPDPGIANESVRVWIDANSNGFYGDSDDILFASGLTTPLGAINLTLPQPYSGQVGVELGDHLMSRARWHCWWYEPHQAYYCLLY